MSLNGAHNAHTCLLCSVYGYAHAPHAKHWRVCTIPTIPPPSSPAGGRCVSHRLYDHTNLSAHARRRRSPWHGTCAHAAEFTRARTRIPREGWFAAPPPPPPHRTPLQQTRSARTSSGIYTFAHTAQPAQWHYFVGPWLAGEIHARLCFRTATSILNDSTGKIEFHFYVVLCFGAVRLGCGARASEPGQHAHGHE